MGWVHGGSKRWESYCIRVCNEVPHFMSAVLAIIYNWCNNNKKKNNNYYYSMFTGNQGNRGSITHFRNAFRFCVPKQRHKMSKITIFTQTFFVIWL